MEILVDIYWRRPGDPKWKSWTKGEPIMRKAAWVALLFGVSATAQEAHVSMQLDMENQVRYGGVAEPAQIATSPQPVASQIQQLNFTRPIVIGDVMSVNGSPAKGAWVVFEYGVRLTPTPT